MNLDNQLIKVREASAKNISSKNQAVMLAEIEILKEQAFEQYAPKVGDFFPSFTLTDQLGHEVSLSEKLAQGPIVLTFYRGGWCPYCNLELRAYQSLLNEIQEQGANLLAITPELPDASLTTAEKNVLAFSVLSDPGSRYTKTLSLVFSLPESLKSIYSNFGIDIEAHNGEGAFELPITATYVIDTSGRIVFADVNADYTQRAEPNDVLQSLKSIT